ncbi:MAG: hypothetical protein ABW203_08780 [Novosphingobium sp.]
MKKRVIAALAVAAASLGMVTERARAEPSASDGERSVVPGWDELIGKLQGLPDRMLAKLPEPMRSDPQVRQEVARLALEAMAGMTLDAIGSDPEHPQFLPALGQVLNIGQPNADTVYRTAKIAPGGSYRLRGERGSLRMAVIAEAGPRPAQIPGQTAPNLGPPRPIHEIGKLRVDDAGRFDVILSAARPANYEGDWWQLDPTTNNLLMRLVGSDWGKEREPTVSIERLDVPPQRPRPGAAALEARLRALPGSIDFIAMLFVDHVELLRQQGYVNKLKVFDLTTGGGLQGQFYYEGAYDLADDEALIVEARAPERCRYRSLILTNELYETTDWYNNHSSLNDAQAPLDADGVLRIVVSARDPGVPNWLDTAGHRRGAIQGRWTECNEQPVPSVRKVKVAEVRKFLPKETPAVTTAEREAIIRDRRAALLERTLW